MKKSIVLLGLCLSVLTGWSAEGWMTDFEKAKKKAMNENKTCLLYTSPSPRDGLLSRMPSSA